MSFFDDVQKARRVGKEKREKEEAARVQREAVKQTQFVDERIDDLVKTAKRIILAAPCPVPIRPRQQVASSARHSPPVIARGSPCTPGL